MKRHLACALRQRLQERGSTATVLVHESCNALLTNVTCPCQCVADHVAPLIQLYVANLVAEHSPDVMILADIQTTLRFLQWAGQTPDFLTAYNLPIFGIDTWHSAFSGTRIDRFFDTEELGDTCGGIPIHRMVPVPFGKALPNHQCYSSITKLEPVASKVRRHIRNNLGLTGNDVLLLYCSAEWQEPCFNNVDGNRIASALPKLLTYYVSRLGKQVHLVHVGPRPYQPGFLDASRYHWLPPLEARFFDLLLASTDLLVTANTSSVTLLKAISLSIPAVVIQNSVQAASLSEALESMSQRPTAHLLAWLELALPIYRFRLWPIGYYCYLEEVLKDNPLRSAILTVELLEEETFVNSINALSFNMQERSRLIERQIAYCLSLDRLPSGGELVYSILRCL